MAEPDSRLTLEDQKMINMAGGLIVGPVSSDAIWGWRIDELRLLLPQVSRGHVLVGDLARALDDLVRLYPGRRRPMELDQCNIWARSVMDVSSALEAIFFWRAALVDQAMRRRGEPEARPNGEKETT